MFKVLYCLLDAGVPLWVRSAPVLGKSGEKSESYSMIIRVVIFPQWVPLASLIWKLCCYPIDFPSKTKVKVR